MDLSTVVCFAFIIFLAVTPQTRAEQVCYEPLGCFSDSFPFTSPQRPVSCLPWSPEDIGTNFLLYTRYNQFSYQLLSYSDPTTIQKSYFNPFRRTKIIVHGFTADGEDKWLLQLKNALLNEENLNVIIVDWRRGANTPLKYWQAATNTRVVGAEIAELINLLGATTGALFGDFHIIGHSLGSHVGGYAGERLTGALQNLGRITGLDPAGPYFEGTLASVRLDPGDATYVDAIHTDSDPIYNLGFGMSGTVGHADFYPNGGFDQPGCIGNEIDNGQFWKVSCSHSRAHELMIDSILNADSPMYGHPCANYEEYKTGSCAGCGAGGCPTLGYYSDQIIYEDDTIYYLETGSESPYAAT